MPFELLVALRYLREGRGQTVLIVVGIAVGVAVVVYLSALITGLQASLIEQTLGTQASVVVRPLEEEPRRLMPPPAGSDAIDVVRLERPAQRVRSIAQWPRMVERIETLPGVTAVAATVAGPAMAIRGQGANSVAVRGIDPARYEGIVELDSRLARGRVDVESGFAVIGTELAIDLGIDLGDRFRLQTGGEPGTVFTVAGVLDLGNRDLNARWVFVSLRAAQAMFGLEGGVSTIEVRSDDVFGAEALAARIADATGLEAESWMETNAQLLVALRSQSASSAMIQVFVMLAVALGIASVLAVSVVQKTREIGILRATGTSTGRVSRVFLVQGMILGGAGALAGVALGSALALFFSTLAQNPDGSATFPVALTPTLFLRTTAVAIIVGLISAAIPARRAAGLDPAAAIRDA